MSGIISALNAATQVITTVNDSDKSTARALIDTLNSQDLKLALTGGSMAKLLGDFIIEPMAIVSDRLKNEEIIENIVDVNVDVFASFYLQTFQILRTLYHLPESAIFDIMATDNSGLGRIILRGADEMVSNEGRDYLKEIFSDVDFSLSTEANTLRHSRADSREQVASTIIQKELEITLRLQRPSHVKRTNRNKRTGSKIRNEYEYQEEVSNPIGRETTTRERLSKRTVEEPQRITIDGKQSDFDSIEDVVETMEDIEYVVIPIIIKTHVIFASTDNILTLLKPNSKDKTFSYRLDEYRASVISLLDFVFCGDIIKEYKKNKLSDKQGLLKMINDRALSANSKIATHKIIGFEKYYNMIFISEEERPIYEKQLNGKLSKDHNKEEFMEGAKALLLNIIDIDYERVIMYTKDLRGKSDITFKSLTKRKGNDKTDYGEIIKAIMGNRTPTF